MKNVYSTFPKAFSFIYKISLFCVCAFAAIEGTCQSIVGWDFDPLPGGANNFGPSPLAPATQDANLTIGGLTRGAGVGTTGTGAGNAFGGTTFNATTAAVAITANAFFTFTVTSNTGFNVNFSQIAPYNIRKSGTGPTSGQWQYGIGGTFTDIGGVFTIGAVTSGAGNNQPAIDLSGIPALQGVAPGTTITFRFIPFGASAAGGTGYFNDPAGTPPNDLIINGTVTPVVVLPVTFSSVNVSAATNKTNVLTWNVETETNIAEYITERSTNGVDFSAFASPVKPANTSTLYQQIDNVQQNGIIFYRVKAVSQNGLIQYSRTIQIKNINAGLDIAVFPNPITGKKINLQINNKPDNYNLAIISAKGETVYTEIFAAGPGVFIKTINLKGTTSAGSYSLIITNQEGIRKTLAIQVL